MTSDSKLASDKEINQRGKEKRYLGLLECPLHKGFVEFEYEAGDRVSELKDQAMRAWGPPRAIGSRRERHDFWDANSWVILCEDEHGGYVVLYDKDTIPLTPLPSTKAPRRSGLLLSPRDYGLPDGVIHIHEAGHLHLAIDRSYGPPDREKYSVKLLALIAISGG